MAQDNITSTSDAPSGTEETEQSGTGDTTTEETHSIKDPLSEFSDSSTTQEQPNESNVDQTSETTPVEVVDPLKEGGDAPADQEDLDANKTDVTPVEDPPSDTKDTKTDDTVEVIDPTAEVPETEKSSTNQTEQPVQKEETPQENEDSSQQQPTVVQNDTQSEEEIAPVDNAEVVNPLSPDTETEKNETDTVEKPQDTQSDEQKSEVEQDISKDLLPEDTKSQESESSEKQVQEQDIEQETDQSNKTQIDPEEPSPIPPPEEISQEDVKETYDAHLPISIKETSPKCVKWECVNERTDCVAWDEGSESVAVNGDFNNSVDSCLLHKLPPVIVGPPVKLELAKNGASLIQNETKLKQDIIQNTCQFSNKGEFQEFLLCSDNCATAQNQISKELKLLNGKTAVMSANQIQRICNYEKFKNKVMETRKGKENAWKLCQNHTQCASGVCACVPSSTGHSRCTSSVLDQIFEDYWNHVCNPKKELDYMRLACEYKLQVERAHLLVQLDANIEEKQLSCIRKFNDYSILDTIYAIENWSSKESSSLVVIFIVIAIMIFVCGGVAICYRKEKVIGGNDFHIFKEQNT